MNFVTVDFALYEVTLIYKRCGLGSLVLYKL